MHECSHILLFLIWISHCIQWTDGRYITNWLILFKCAWIKWMLQTCLPFPSPKNGFFLCQAFWNWLTESGQKSPSSLLFVSSANYFNGFSFTLTHRWIFKEKIWFAQNEKTFIQIPLTQISTWHVIYFCAQFNLHILLHATVEFGCTVNRKCRSKNALVLLEWASERVKKREQFERVQNGKELARATDVQRKIQFFSSVNFCVAFHHA